MAEQERPTLIRLRTVIGYGSPGRAGTRQGSQRRLRCAREVRATKEALGWDPDAQFLVPDEVAAHYARGLRGARRRSSKQEWAGRFEAWAARQP